MKWQRFVANRRLDSGYWRMTKIRINHALSSNNLLDPTPLSNDGPSYLASTLPKRARPRPKIMARTMPQRQVPEPIDSDTKARLHTFMRDIASAHPDILEVKPSHTEGKSTDGLYARPNTSALNPVARDKLLNHEIAHVHPAENSLHVWLSEPDARVVIEAGWGQRFPLTFVNKGWTMVYAPMNMNELEIVEKIVKAGIAWITGVGI
jgi:hypothetical protein